MLGYLLCVYSEVTGEGVKPSDRRNGSDQAGDPPALFPTRQVPLQGSAGQVAAALHRGQGPAFLSSLSAETLAC